MITRSRPRRSPRAMERGPQLSSPCYDSVMTTSHHPLVQLDVRDQIATLLLDRPDKRNALDRGLMESIAGALDAVRDDAAVRVVVLRGKGAAFSSGIDHNFLVEIFQKSQSAPFA